MSDKFNNEPMLDMFIFETSQLLEQLEQSILSSEKMSCYTHEAINEIFRIMHTIKGSAAMMMFDNISTLAHAIEDMFYFLREEKPKNIDCSTLSDLIFESVDFIKVEIEKIKNGDKADGNSSALIENLEAYLEILKRENKISPSSSGKAEECHDKQQYYVSPEKSESRTYKNIFKAVIYFEEGCEMENIRAYTVINSLKDITDTVFYLPDNIIDNDNTVEVIRKSGFKIFLKADYSFDQMNEFFMQTIFLKDLELVQLENDDEFMQFAEPEKIEAKDNTVKVPSLNDDKEEVHSNSAVQSIISVNVLKLDKLMDLVGEMVIAEAMVIQNPDLKGLELDNFEKSARQLSKITSEIQDMVMSIRMVPLAATFQKMNRIVRDMCKKLGKEAHLEIIGEQTEVDKNIIEHISDPLMHLVRNSIDHGIESVKERLEKGKPEVGTVTLEAKNAGSDVLVIVRDDGKGLNKEKILAKARESGLIRKAEEDMTDKEIYNLIFLPGFSTKEAVSEFSGRGVGMDVVAKNVEAVGGSISIESVPGKGSAITLKIPLTLAIIDGMNIRVGNSCYTIPTISIKQSFKPKENDIITDPDGNEMIMVRGNCYSILRLHKLFGVKTQITEFVDGIVIMLEQDEKIFCIFADELLGQQQVVVKALPDYIRRFKKIKGLAGCTLLGDGNISLILDITGIMAL